ncbi:choline/carnitine/betaine transport [Goodfellowiella coeruleoviolacea]|uniref:Choline/carnitine/betaine transport n=1 Tax=Goodfellowiella coeruleoviolacea TaxID=334858 RepID=A0AAE3GIX8_9PSEU|nr:BCCT family transporter [Goodfellowiella coeruleoviolacea]MCP2169046.1 choline/carnitine/betaine transport [Goodfellowiella coeruleoviolacea]
MAAAVAVAFVAWGVLGADSLGSVADAALGWIIANLGWAFVLVSSAFVVFALWLALSRYGKIPLGRDDEKPEFRTVSWVAMMFSAGMGIGLMFYGVSEPLAHFVTPPPGTQPADVGEATEVAMATTLFHWTLHPWSIYAVVGLAIAYGSFRRGRSQLISAAFAPLLGTRRVRGPAGKTIDVLAIFATLFGSAASLGLGALQIGSGLRAAGWLGETGTGLLVTIIAVLTVAFVASAVSGVAKGIQWLSNINMVLAVVLAVFLFVVGPTVLILNLVPTSIGEYFRDLAAMAARTAAAGGDGTETWLSGWTIFYWAWWISWTPFVGMFIARISRGRTIRQFVGGVIVVPSVVSLIWFAILGGTAIDVQRGGTDLAGQASQEAQLFGLLDHFPLAAVAGVVVMVLVAIFFVSGADAASIVMGTLSQRGSIEPTKRVVVFWGVLTGAVAAVMLVVGQKDALTGLQNLTIIAALPFMVVMVGLCVSLARDLRSDPLVRREERMAQVLDEVTEQLGDVLAVSDTTAAPPVEGSTGAAAGDGTAAGDTGEADVTGDTGDVDGTGGADRPARTASAHVERGRAVLRVPPHVVQAEQQVAERRRP